MIFDAHQHASPAMVQDAAYREGVMDRAGIRAAALMAAHDYDRPDGQVQTRAMNDFVARFRDEHRDRFPVAIGTLEPIQGADVGIAELDRMRNGLKMDGVVFHHLYHGTGIADAARPLSCRRPAGSK